MTGKANNRDQNPPGKIEAPDGLYQGGSPWNIPCIEPSDEEKLCKRPLVSQEDLISTFDIASIDYLFLHHVNKFIDKKIRKPLKVPAEKVPFCIADFAT